MLGPMSRNLIDTDAEELTALTPKQRAFVEAYIQLGFDGQEQAARMAGYSSPDSSAYQLVRNPKVLAALRYLTKTKGQVGTMAAMDYLLETVRGINGAPHPVRLGAAKELLDRGGLPAELNRRLDINITDNRTVEQIEAAVREKMSRLAAQGLNVPQLGPMAREPEVVDADFIEIDGEQDD